LASHPALSKEQCSVDFTKIIHIVLQIIQAGAALALIAVVMSQTNKDQGMGGALSGQNADASRYKGGYEEKLDALAAKLVGTFLIASFLVALIARKIS
jgi:protein translocase SecG subunit